MAPNRREAIAATARVGDMARRLERRLEQAGLDHAARSRVSDVCTRAMMHRVGVLGSDAHFDALHPARTLLILLDDCDVTDADVLRAAATVESELPRLRVDGDSLGADGRPLGASVPLPDTAGPALVEELLAADGPIRLIALAERLDHARHLHLRAREAWAPFHALVVDVYAPLAARTHPRLARRYAWWRDTFRRRFLEG